jgi:hypothetical protein
MDEVTAALQLCLRRGGARALFWTWELVVSDEAPTAFNAIRHAWLLWGGGHDPALLDLPLPSSSAADPWIHLLDRVTSAITDAGTLTVEKLLTRTQTHTPTPPTRILQRGVAAAFATAVEEELPDVAASASFWNALAVACHSQQRVQALWLLQAVTATDRLCADRLWTAIQMIAASTVPASPALRTTVASLRHAASPHPESQLLHQATAILVIINSRIAATPPTSTVPSVAQLRDWATWTAVIDNVRAARVHAIPVEALHVGTTRGSMSAKYTNDADIHNPVALLPAACRWWRTQTATAGLQSDPLTESVSWTNDDAHEAFYARHFPPHIDIPDEWSLADRAKSHGRGVQETAPPTPTCALLTEPPSDTAWTTAIQFTDPPHGGC